MPETKPEPPGRTVVRRHVYFFGGFDPKGAAFYHRLYREQARLQGQLTGDHYAVGARVRTGHESSTWEIHQTRGQSPGTYTTYECVHWDDVVRACWPKRWTEVLGQSIRTYLAATVPAMRHIRSAPKTVLALFYPLVFWLAIVWLAVAGGIMWWRWLPLTGVKEVVTLVWFVGVLALGMRWERTLHTSWLLHIYAFARRWACNDIPLLDARLDAVAAQVHARLQNPEVDEVLLVGFSVGSMLAVSAAARVPAGSAEAAGARARLGVLTLGHCIPLLGLMPQAEVFRSQLRDVGLNPWVDWVDISAPGDWGSFALVDPVALCVRGLDAGAAVNPRVLVSPRFHRLFEPTEYRMLKKHKRRMHMQYLKAAGRPGGYDFFAITAGDMTVAERADRGMLS